MYDEENGEVGHTELHLMDEATNDAYIDALHAATESDVRTAIRRACKGEA